MLKQYLCGIITAILWLMTFQAGLLISSKPFREEIGAGRLTARNFSLALLTYTITNLAFLCWLAGIAGATGRHALVTAGPIRRTEKPRAHVVSEICSAAVLRSFLIYLLFLAGVFISTSNPFEYTQEQYTRMAGTISILSFLVNYEPAFFNHLIGRIRSQQEALVEAGSPHPNSPAPPALNRTSGEPHGTAQKSAQPHPLTTNGTGDKTK